MFNFSAKIQTSGSVCNSEKNSSQYNTAKWDFFMYFQILSVSCMICHLFLFLQNSPIFYLLIKFYDLFYNIATKQQCPVKFNHQFRSKTYLRFCDGQFVKQSSSKTTLWAGFNIDIRRTRSKEGSLHLQILYWSRKYSLLLSLPYPAAAAAHILATSVDYNMPPE